MKKKEELVAAYLKEEVALSYQWFTYWKTILWATFAVVVVYSIYTLSNPFQSSWQEGDRIHWGFVIRHFLIDVYLIELITCTLLYYSIRWYAKWLKLDRLSLNWSNVVIYNLKFLPLLLLAFFWINPFTQTIRYWYNFYPKWNWEIYCQDYFYSTQLYLLYLIPIFLLAYGILNINILKSIQRQKFPSKKKGNAVVSIITAKGDGFFPMEEVQWFFVHDRKYFVQTEKGKFRIRSKLNDLEQQLDSSKFSRINRGVIANLKWVDSFAYWENDKYVLHMKDANKTQFTISRQRMKDLKRQLQF